ncbi:hypothetical protein BWQ96_00870 [Gracilariopsis chorda]|uniref:Uncharacterized protein n=1 Tax=Gracilariopsis chorda TaxID=448386 RepID=A0A2V3J4B5_9FLOR|nr:hypothetical protein BWQ96_00870 [Gracilariopsis chorda]|eukprot:PXF49296.1 hypothetical protein BWQ96_00870 [Gracilariopsis chorda]
MFAAPGPIVSATIVVGTRPISNAGHPHTLEHIVFLGSEKHPVRGYLDNLACRCIADGTNAWTDNDHTAYTCATAGFDGFANLLPSLLDHVLRPKINDASFASEVYHVRSDGKEAGVVFCEMQAREHTEADLSDRAMRCLLLAGTPLCYEAGGLCEDIRHLSNEEIVRFHQDQYCGANTTIIVGGSQISPRDLLGCIKSELDDISSCPGFNPGYPQWQKPLSLKELSQTTRRIIPFPCPDNNIGTITFGWRGPGASDRYTNTAVNVLLHYLCGDVWSPMRQRFVETEDQVASDITYSSETFRNVSTIELYLEGIRHLDHNDDDENDGDDDGESGEDMGVDDEAREEDGESSLLTSGKVEQMVLEFLQSIVGSGKLPGGLECVHAAIKTEKESFVAGLESDCHGVVPSLLIEEVVYGADLHLTIGEEVRGSLEQYDALVSENEKYWMELLNSVFIKPHHVVLVMVPDTTLAETLAEKENTAHQQRVQRIGKDTLHTIGKANEEIIASLKPGTFDSDCFPPLPSTSNISRWAYSVTQVEEKGFIAQSVKLESDIVRCALFIDTSDLPVSERVFLSVLQELLLECDIRMKDGSIIPYTDNARHLNEVTITTPESGVFVGFTGGMADNCIGIHYAASPASFEEATKCVLLNLFQTEVTAERLATVSQSLLVNSTEALRDGWGVVKSTVNLVPYLQAATSEDVHIPNYAFRNCVGMHPLFSFLAEEFTRKDARKKVQNAVLQRLGGLLESLKHGSAEKVFFQVTARNPKAAYDSIKRQWSKYRSHNERNPSSDGKRYRHASAITRRTQARLSDLVGKHGVAHIVSVAGVETTHVDIRVESEVHEGHADWSALTVLLEMLSRMEGPVSDAVRVTGLAYGVFMGNNGWRGRMNLQIYESSSPAAAWDAVCEALIGFRASLDDEAKHGKIRVELETAKASTLFTLNEERATPDAIMNGALARTANGIPASPLADRTGEERIERVSLECLRRCYDRHVCRFLRECGRLVVVSCGAGAVEETCVAFRKCKYPVRLVERSLEGLRAPFVEVVVEELNREEGR